MEPLSDGLCSVCGEYVTATRQALRLGRANDRPLRAHDAFVEEAWRDPGHFDDRSLLDSAVRLACQDMLIEAGVCNRAGRVPVTPQYIAKTAPSFVARRHSERAREGKDIREVNRRARWKEARWQVQRVIATEPAPPGNG
ncbi:hypothetical protein [Streptomyces sp. NPDC002779]|uniref:hypothetical protein n=1 Tax=Streptomyces sp. NPDC002779 TaxID=3364664 RepID=UPI0036B08221